MRAQYKAVEDLSDNVACCETTRQAAAEHSGEVIELGELPTGPHSIRCSHCDRVYFSYIYAVIGQHAYQWVGVEEIDIEEGT